MSFPIETGYQIDISNPEEFEKTIIFSVFLLPASIIALCLWMGIFIAIIKDRHYLDPNNLFLISFGLADMLLSGVVTAQMSLSLVLTSSFSITYHNCITQALFLAIGFCASGLSVVVIALDRYLLMCYNFHKSWSKTLTLLLIGWGIAIIFPVVGMFTNLPDFVMVTAGRYCIPNFASTQIGTRSWLILCLVLIYSAFATVVFCYGSVFYKYAAVLRKKEQNDDSSDQQKIQKMPANAKRLLYKFSIISVCFFVSFLPLTFSFLYMLSKNHDTPWQYTLFCDTLVLLSPIMNPVLIYFLDAKMKMSINGLFWAESDRGKISKSSTNKPPSSPKGQRSPSAPVRLVVHAGPSSIATTNQLETVLIPATRGRELENE